MIDGHAQKSFLTIQAFESNTIYPDWLTGFPAFSNAIDNLQNSRATIGANQNRLEFASANIATAVENTEAARSQLLDLDIAMEMSNFVSKQILIQAGVAMLSQANQLPNNLLRLFQ